MSKRSDALDEDLRQYAAAADATLRLRKRGGRAGQWALFTAAAGSALALAPDAEAAIIYSGVQNLTLTSGSASLDLDQNSVMDFAVSLSSWGASTASARLWRREANGVLGGAYDVQRLSSGVSVGAGTGPFGFGGDLRLIYYGSTYGEWPGGSPSATSGFAGVSFDRSGETHYGWIRFELLNDPSGLPTQLTVVDWAWEDTPNASIQTGQVAEPGSLVLLAMGAAGLAALGRRRSP